MRTQYQIVYFGLRWWFIASTWKQFAVSTAKATVVVCFDPREDQIKIGDFFPWLEICTDHLSSSYPCRLQWDPETSWHHHHIHIYWHLVAHLAIWCWGRRSEIASQFMVVSLAQLSDPVNFDTSLLYTIIYWISFICVCSLLQGYVGPSSVRHLLHVLLLLCLSFCGFIGFHCFLSSGFCHPPASGMIIAFSPKRRC